MISLIRFIRFPAPQAANEPNPWKYSTSVPGRILDGANVQTHIRLVIDSNQPVAYVHAMMNQIKSHLAYHGSNARRSQATSCLVTEVFMLWLAAATRRRFNTATASVEVGERYLAGSGRSKQKLRQCTRNKAVVVLVVYPCLRLLDGA